MKILVIGGPSGTGQAIVREALAHDHEVVTLIRTQATAGALLPGARLEQGDARDPAALFRALAGFLGERAVVVTDVASRPVPAPEPAHVGNEHGEPRFRQRRRYFMPSEAGAEKAVA